MSQELACSTVVTRKGSFDTRLSREALTTAYNITSAK